MTKYIIDSHVQGKVLYFDYDAMLDLSEDTCLFCLSERDVQLILASLEPMAWKTRWISQIDTPISQDTLDSWQVTLQEALMSDVCADITAKLNQIYELLQGVSTVVDNTETAVDIIGGEVSEIAVQQLADSVVIGEIAAQQVIDSTAIAGLVVAAAAAAGALAGIATTVNEIDEDVDNIEELIVVDLQKVNDASDNYQINYIINIIANPPAEQPGKFFSGKDTDVYTTERYARWFALVKASLRFIKSICYRMLAVNDPSRSADLASVWQDMATLGGVVLGILATEPLGTFGETFDDILAALADGTAMTAVACAMASYLMTVENNYANFLAACGAGTFTSGTNEFLLQEVIYAAETVDAIFQYNYHGFLSALAGEFVLAMTAVPPPSAFVYLGCTYDPVIPLVADFTVNNFAGWTIKYGHYVPDQGVQSDHVFDPGSGNIYNVAWVEIDFPSLASGTNITFEILITTDAEGLSVPQVNGINLTTFVMVGGVCTLSHVTPTSVPTLDAPYVSVGTWPDSNVCHMQFVQYSRNRYYIRKVTLS